HPVRTYLQGIAHVMVHLGDALHAVLHGAAAFVLEAKNLGGEGAGKNRGKAVGESQQATTGIAKMQQDAVGGDVDAKDHRRHYQSYQQRLPKSARRFLFHGASAFYLTRILTPE